MYTTRNRNIFLYIYIKATKMVNLACHTPYCHTAIRNKTSFFKFFSIFFYIIIIIIIIISSSRLPKWSTWHTTPNKTSPPPLPATLPPLLLLLRPPPRRTYSNTPTIQTANYEPRRCPNLRSKFS